MGGITYGTIEAGAVGFASPHVIVALAVGFAFVVFAVAQACGREPRRNPASRRPL
jgi:hypothetical protein